MSCTDNIKAMFILRSQLALFSHGVSDRARCERVVQTELEDQEFMFNVMEHLGLRMCRTDAMPKLVIGFDSSYLASDPGGSAAFTLYNGKGAATSPVQLMSSQIPSSLADTVISALDFQQTGGVLTPVAGIYRYFKSADNEVTIIFKPGYVGSYTVTYSTANTAGSYVTLTGGPTATLAYEQGSMCSAAGDQDGLKRIIQWFSSRINVACDDKVFLANMGKCPPEEYVSCDLISPGVFSFQYFEEFIAGGLTNYNPLPPSTSPNISLQSSIIFFNDPILELDVTDDPELTITESTTGDIYYLKSSTAGLDPNWSGDAAVYWVVQGVLPFGETERVDAEAIFPVDPDATYTWGGTLPVKTNKGNTCPIVLNNTFLGSDFYTVLPEPMTLVNLTFSNTRITGAYTQVPIPKPPSIVSLYKDGSVIYEWVVGSDPYLTFDGGLGFDLEFPPEIGPLEEPGTYSVSWPQGWVCGKSSLALAPAVALNDFTYVVAGSPATGFTYTFPFTLS